MQPRESNYLVYDRFNSEPAEYADNIDPQIRGKRMYPHCYARKYITGNSFPFGIQITVHSGRDVIKRRRILYEFANAWTVYLRARAFRRV